MRRVAILLATGVATLTTAGLGTLMTAAPAHADPLASVSVIIEKPPVSGLLSLCITSQTLDPGGTCIHVP
jgi:hypothetical protein